jgi:hypothetical protein
MIVPVLGSTSSTASEQAPGRILAIGDIHGEYEGLVSILREIGLVDQENHWIGGNATLVQTGDFVDRGAGVRQVMDLLMRLQMEAPAQGGRVVVLLGNHEAMNLIHDFQDATPEIFATFAGENSEQLLEETWGDWVQSITRLARSRGSEKPSLTKERKERWMKEHPPGFVEYLQAMSTDGHYGKWLLGLPVMAKIGDTLFMHAGIGPDYAQMSVEEVNELHRSEFETFVDNRTAMVEKGIIPSYFNLYEINQALVYQVTNPPLEKYQDAKDQKLIVRAAEDLNQLQEILLQNGPLWYRGYSMLPDQELLDHLEVLEDTYGVRRFVVAHSPMETGSIHQRLSGRVFLIDTGMLNSYYHGRASALEVEDGQISAVYENERRVLVESPDHAVPASAATKDTAAGQRFMAVPAVYRSGGSGRMLPAAYPPAGDDKAKMPPRVWRNPDLEPLPFATAEEAQAFLSSAKVLSQEDIPKGVTKPKKILLEKDGVRAHAKFGSVHTSGQREKLADGTVEMYFLDSFKADMATYELSRLLGLDNVPPAVVRNIDGEDGIMQLWIENLTSYEDWIGEGNTGTPPSLYFRRQVRDMRVFDLLIRNIDRHQGNIMWDPDNNLWLIDQTRSLAGDKKLRNPDKFDGCSRTLYDAIKKLDDQTITDVVTPYLSKMEIKALLKRRELLLKLIESEIKKEGEGEVLFNYGDPPKGLTITYDDSAA